MDVGTDVGTDVGSDPKNRRDFFFQQTKKKTYKMIIYHNPREKKCSKSVEEKLW